MRGERGRIEKRDKLRGGREDRKERDVLKGEREDRQRGFKKKKLSIIIDIEQYEFFFIEIYQYAFFLYRPALLYSTPM